MFKDIIVLIQQNNLPAALQECDTQIQQDPNNPELYHLRGLIYAQQRKLDSALKEFKLAIELEPSQAIYHNNISNTYKMLGYIELASRHLHEALRLSPNNAESYNNLGSLYYTQGQISQALPLFEKAIRLNPNSWEAHYNLANSYIRSDMVLQAIEEYYNVLKLNPEHGNAKLNLAMALVSIKDYAQALPYLIIAAENNPQHAEIQGHLAEAYLDLGKSDIALQQYIKALKLEPTRAEWQHNLAVLYLRDKQLELAKQHFKLSLELQPDNPTAQHMLTALENKTSSAAPAEYVSELFDQYASYYNEHVKNKLDYQVPKLLRQAISKFLTEHSKPQNILDLGCGTGMCGVYFRDLADFLVGVDLSPGMLHQAKTLGAYDGLCRCDILQVIPGYNRAVFDLVLAADVLVYIGDLESLFSIVKGALRNNGKFAFTIEKLDSEQDFALQSTGRYAHSGKYVQKLCEKFKFKIEMQDHIVLRQQDDLPIHGYLFVLSNIDLG